MTQYILDSPAKINITLRVGEQRSDGKHDLVSLFLRIPAAEKLTLRYLYSDNVREDVLRVYGWPLTGKNILRSVMEAARRREPAFPPLEMTLFKHIPPGTGLGAGSGNAAALVEWLRTFGGVEISSDDILALGADIPFLSSADDIAICGGLGQKILFGQPEIPRRPLRLLAVIPRWRCNTGELYAMLDLARTRNVAGTDPGEAGKEALSIMRRLSAMKPVGELPNDFLPVVASVEPAVEKLSTALRSSGALGWGLSGSGSAMFALYPPFEELSHIASEIESTGLVDQILVRDVLA